LKDGSPTNWNPARIGRGCRISAISGAGCKPRATQAKTFYLDRASQICMPSWSRCRVALLGDAAASPSLLAGQGSALAMVEAYVLAAQRRHALDGPSLQGPIVLPTW